MMRRPLISGVREIIGLRIERPRRLLPQMPDRKARDARALLTRARARPTSSGPACRAPRRSATCRSRRTTSIHAADATSRSSVTIAIEPVDQVERTADASRRPASRSARRASRPAAPLRPAGRARCRRARRAERSGCSSADAREQVAGRMILRDRRRWRCGRRRRARCRARARSRRVVGALAVHVRPQQLEQRRHRRLGEDVDVVDAAERRHELGAILGLQDRAGPAPSLPPSPSSLTATIRRSASAAAACR